MSSRKEGTEKKGGEPTAPASAPELDLEALGIYTSRETRDNAFARVLLVGPPKAGKTTCVAATAPKPLVINCDGYGATHGAARAARAKGAEFLTLDADDADEIKRAINTARQLVEKGLVETVVLDTVSMLVATLVQEAKLTLTGWDVWTTVYDRTMKAVRALMGLSAHLFVTSHMTADTGDDNPAGILPHIPGKQLRVDLPALLADWVVLDIEPERLPHERMFLLGPQKYWTASGRHVKRTCAIPADVPSLLAELEIPE
jgi:hypothetical protein